jgi:hypothetical protein
MHRFTDVADGETYLAVPAGLDSAQLGLVAHRPR